jgi:hypothetical protein
MRTAPIAAALLAVPLLAPLPALACSKGSLWAPLDEDVVYFTGSATADTLLAGPGGVQFGMRGGHFGPGVQRPIHGQVVAVEALGGAAVAGMPQGVEAVVVVPWDYDPSCRPLAWSRSARWVPIGTSAFYIAQLRAPEHWVDGLPTVDLHNPGHLPYTGTEAIRGVPSDTPVDSMLSPAQLFGLYEAFPTRRQIHEAGAAALEPLRAWIDRHPELVRRAPVEMLVNSVVGTVDRAALSRTDHPVRGTWRFAIRLPNGLTRTVYGRVDPESITRWTPSRAARGWSPEQLLPAASEGLQLMIAFADTPEELRTIGPPMDHPRGHVSTRMPPSSGTAEVSSWAGLLDPSFLVAALPRHPVARQASREFQARYRSTYAAGLPHPMPATFERGLDGVLRVRQSFALPDGEEVVVEGEQLAREIPSTSG